MDPSGEFALILGVTLSGRPFRPGDWIDRLSGVASTFGTDRSLRYSPYARPVVVDGLRGLLLDSRLREHDPCAFDFIRAFADENDLTVQRRPLCAERFGNS